MTGQDDTDTTEPGKQAEPAHLPGPSPSPEPSGAAVPPGAKAVATFGAKSATKRVGARSAPRRVPTAGAAKRTGGSVVSATVAPVRPATLAIDIGATGLKASVLDAAGKLVADRVRVPTSYPCSPEGLLDALAALVAPLPAFDRVSVGFPGVVRKGVVVTAPHFVTLRPEPGSPVILKLLAAWTGLDLAAALQARLGHPVRVANDADVQGLAVVSGSGLEFVVTLGTGLGTALFQDGRLAPHLELSQHPFRKGDTYDEQIGDATLRRIGVKRWRKRVDEAFSNFHTLLNYDRLYVGGGNSRVLAGHVDPSVTIVDNIAGILGGIKLWELPGN
ncbi:MAG: ROK family protein [Acidimicrobiales bacterium]|jgi:polyphosphate glucokinase